MITCPYCSAELPDDEGPAYFAICPACAVPWEVGDDGRPFVPDHVFHQHDADLEVPDEAWPELPDEDLDGGAGLDKVVAFVRKAEAT